MRSIYLSPMHSHRAALIIVLAAFSIPIVRETLRAVRWIGQKIGVLRRDGEAEAPTLERGGKVLTALRAAVAVPSEMTGWIELTYGRVRNFPVTPLSVGISLYLNPVRPNLLCYLPETAAILLGAISHCWHRSISEEVGDPNHTRWQQWRVTAQALGIFGGSLRD